MNTSSNDTSWSSNWEDDELEKLRAFRALSVQEKILAVEAMQATAVSFLKKAEKRRSAQTQRK